MNDTQPIVGVSVAAFQSGKVLLIKRGKEPYHGLWSLPGGTISLGETAIDAAKRELQEETGLCVNSLSLSGVSDAIIFDGTTLSKHYVIITYTTHEIKGEINVDSDAKDAGWFGISELSQLDATPGLVDSIEKALRRYS